MDVAVVEARLAQLRVIGQQRVKLAAIRVQQRGACFLRAGGGGEQMDFGRDECRILAGNDAQGIQGFGEDLRRHAGDGKQNAAGKGVRSVHAASVAKVGAGGMAASLLNPEPALDVPLRDCRWPQHRALLLPRARRY